MNDEEKGVAEYIVQLCKEIRPYENFRAELLDGVFAVVVDNDFGKIWVAKRHKKWFLDTNEPMMWMARMSHKTIISKSCFVSESGNFIRFDLNNEEDITSILIESINQSLGIYTTMPDDK